MKLYAAAPRQASSELTVMRVEIFPCLSSMSLRCNKCLTNMLMPSVKGTCSRVPVRAEKKRNGTTTKNSATPAGVKHGPMNCLNCAAERRPVRFASSDSGENPNAFERSNRTCSLVRNAEASSITKAQLLIYRRLELDTLTSCRPAPSQSTPQSCD